MVALDGGRQPEVLLMAAAVVLAYAWRGRAALRAASRHRLARPRRLTESSLGQATVLVEPPSEDPMP